MKSEIIPEIEVLISCTLWLIKRGLLPIQFSIASGSGINLSKDKNNLLNALVGFGIPHSSLRFRPDGPDIIASSQVEYWQIECKGAGSGKGSTQRNNFDRAVSSVVSYSEIPDEVEKLRKKPFLGLAFPSTTYYLNYLQKRVPPSLRRKLNLWILLYDVGTKNIISISPEDSCVNKLKELNFEKYLPKNQELCPPRTLESSDNICKKASSIIQTKYRVHTDSGDHLNRKWNVGANHSLYHKDGIWYMPIQRFPGAYFDQDGYVLFETETEYKNNRYLKISKRVNVSGGISRLPGYKKMR